MIYAFDDYELDTRLYMLRLSGQSIRLRRKAFQLLLYLVMHRDRVVSKNELCEQLWPGQFISDTTLESTVWAVRQALGDTRYTQRLIQTLSGYGYRFIAVVKEHLDSPLSMEATLPLSLRESSSPLHEEGPDVVTAVPWDTTGASQATILVVDDQITVVKRLEALLQPRGYTVIIAIDGAEALRQVQQAKPDLIILDVMMPGMDGFDICRRLKERDETRLIPVVLMTALGDVQDRIKGLEAGADDFLTKPVHRDELLARIRTSLRLKQTIDSHLVRLRQPLSLASPLFLTVLRQGHTIAMELLEATPGAPGGQLPVEASLLAEIDVELSRILTPPDQCEASGAAGDQGVRGRSEVAHVALQGLGSLIFASLFPDAIRQRLREATPTTLFLRLDPHLVQVPWEFAFDGREFLLTKFHIGRQVITPQLPPSPPLRSTRTSGVRKLLIVVDPTEKQPGAVQEAERLAAMLGAYEHLAVSIKGGKELRKMHLLLALREYDLVHYLGHICFDTMQSSRSGWLLHNDVLTGADLGKVIPSPLLMFVNAYHIEGTCQPTDIGYKGSALRLGSTFLLAGIPHCITTVGATLDARNTAFAAAFYRHLCEGEDIGTALAAARCEALQQADLHDALWASYVHYGNPTSQLWPVTS